VSQWSIDGFTWQIYYTQTFKVSGTDTHIDGPDLLEQVFHKYNVHSWGMFGVLIGYVLFFRFSQYLLFAIQTGTITLPFMGSRQTQTEAAGQGTKVPSYQAVPTADKKDQSGLEIAPVGPAAGGVSHL
jgi:hypothetical protein